MPPGLREKPETVITQWSGNQSGTLAEDRDSGFPYTDLAEQRTSVVPSTHAAVVQLIWRPNKMMTCDKTNTWIQIQHIPALAWRSRPEERALRVLFHVSRGAGDSSAHKRHTSRSLCASRNDFKSNYIDTK